MSKINSPPIGLQSLLGSQNFGENPNDLLREARAIVDLWPFLSAYQFDTVGLSNTGVTSTSLALLGQVPNGELWFLAGVGVEMSMTTFEANAKAFGAFYLDFVLDSTLTGGARHQIAGPVEFQACTQAAGAFIGWGHDFTRPYPLRAGEQIRFLMSNITRTTGSFAYAANARFYRLAV